MPSPDLPRSWRIQNGIYRPGKQKTKEVRKKLHELSSICRFACVGCFRINRVLYIYHITAYLLFSNDTNRRTFRKSIIRIFRGLIDFRRHGPPKLIISYLRTCVRINVSIPTGLFAGFRC